MFDPRDYDYEQLDRARDAERDEETERVELTREQRAARDARWAAMAACEENAPLFAATSWARAVGLKEAA